MAEKKTAPTPFAVHIGRACAGIEVHPAEGPPPDTRGRWRPYSEKLHAVCTGIRGAGGRFVAGLASTEKEMRTSGAQYQVLCSAEQALVDALRNVRAAKEGVKLVMLDQSGAVVTTLTCQAQDPRTSPAERATISALSAPALGLIEESTAAQAQKGRTTRGRNAGFRTTIATLSSENQALRTAEEAPPPPAPRAARRRSPR